MTSTSGALPAERATAPTLPAATLWIWGTIVVVFALDCVWLSCAQMTLAWTGSIRPLVAIVLLGMIAVIYSVTGRSDSIARAAHSAAQFIAFSVVGAVLSYLAAATHAPLVDGALRAADASLGFDWSRWAAWLTTHPSLRATLAVAYALLLPMVVVCLLWLALTGSADELMAMLIVSALVTIACSGILPAIGNLPHAPQMPQLIALRAGTMREIPLNNLQGLIAFPSFHTTLAIILAYASRRSRWLFRIALPLTVLILISVPSGGGHYLVDIISGGGVALGAIALAPLRRECRDPASSAPRGASTPLERGRRLAGRTQ